MGDQLDVFVINKFHANFFIGPMSALKVFLSEILGMIKIECRKTLLLWKRGIKLELNINTTRREEKNFILKGQYQVWTCERFTVFGIRWQNPVNLADGDFHSSLPVHKTLRHKLKVKPAALNRKLSFYFNAEHPSLNTLYFGTL